MASVFTERACSYRNKNKIIHETTEISVVIQEMIQSEVSGILFTANPLNNNRNESLIDASYGLGESLVSGMVEPDTYKINNKSLIILDKKLGKKNFVIEKGENDSVISKNKESKLEVQSLTNEKVKELVVMGNKIEKHYKIPMDIEWVLYKDKFYILRGRAITTLFPLVEDRTKNDDDVYLSFNHIQVMTRPMSPLSLDIWQYLLPFGKKEKKSKSLYLVKAGGFLYLNFSRIIYENKMNEKFISKIKNVGKDFGEILAEYIERDCVKLKIKKDMKLRKSFLYTITPLIFRAVPHLLFPRKNIVFSVNKSIEEISDHIKKEVGETDNFKKIEGIKTSLSFLMDDTVKRVIPKILAAFIAWGELSKILPGEISDKLLELTMGERGNITTEMGISLNRISDFYREIPQGNIERSKNMDELMDLLTDEKEKKEIRNFFDNYGVRGVGEIDLSNKRYFEDISLVVNSIVSNIQNNGDGEAAVRFNKLKESSKRLRDEVESALAHRGILIRMWAGHLMDVIQRNFVLREHGKYSLVKGLWIIKKEILKLGDVLAENKLIFCDEDIFYLELDEIEEALRKNRSFQEIIENRKIKYREYQKLKIPKIILNCDKTWI